MVIAVPSLMPRLKRSGRGSSRSHTRKDAKVLDPTAGGGSIPFESERLGLSTYANDLNPVAALILIATTVYPALYGLPVADEFAGLASRFRSCSP